MKKYITRENVILVVILLIAIRALFIGLKSYYKGDEIPENEVNKGYIMEKDIFIKDKTAFIDVDFDRPGGTFLEAKVKSNNVVLYSADRIKFIVDNYPKTQKIILRIRNFCEDNYGKITFDEDEIPFNSSEILEFKKYINGEKIAYSCVFYRVKLKTFWTPCGDEILSSLIY
jgi:dTDP-D-glucose 4,6-dehydratase